MTKREPTAFQARKSAWAVGAVLLVIAAWNVYRDLPHIYWSFGSIGGTLVLVGLLWARGAIAFHKGWMMFAATLGAINTRIILAVIFYLVMTPYGLLMRLMGRDVLNWRKRSTGSHWVVRPETRQPVERFERLF